MRSKSKILSSLIAICMLCAISTISLAGGKVDDKEKMIKEHFDLSHDVVVVDKLVKKGRYLVKYDPDTGVVMFFDGDEVVATASAEVVMSNKHFDSDQILIRTEGDVDFLTGLRLGGQREELTIVGSANRIAIVIEQ